MENFFAKTKEEAIEGVEGTAEGLSFAAAKKRLEQNGKNVLKQKKKKGALLQFLSQFKDVLIIVLLVSFALCIVIGIVEKSVDEYVDAGIILIVVLFNAIVGFIQERNSERAMEALKNMTKQYCTVARNGRTFKIKAEELVLGDIVLLEAGDIVPADIRLLESNSLKIEESALTGESVAVEKDSEVILEENALLGDRVNMAFMGSVVTYGRGKGVVVGCGMNTEMGKIASALNEIKDTETPLTKRIHKTNLIITAIVLIVSLVIFVVELCTGGGIFGSFSMAIAIAVCAIPEGLPACVTIAMSLGVKRMSQRRAIVKHLPAVETLGSTQVICSDKTGTLTLNKMTIKKVFYFGGQCGELEKIEIDAQTTGNAVENTLSVEEVGEHTTEIFKKDRNFVEIMRCMLLCNDTKTKFEDEKLECIGDPTEIALVHYGYKLGISKENLDGELQRINEIPFDSDRKLMSTFHQVEDKKIMYTKGAVDSVLARCNRILDDGKIRRLTAKDKEDILAKNSEFADSALRILAFAFKSVEKVGRPTSANSEFDLCFLGLVGMIDPPREEVKDSIKVCKQAGIHTIMITGDHKDTAFAIARELGICTDKDKVITGKELNEIPDEEFVKVVEKYQVYARVSPEHKVKIVRALKANDKIVAMTGDGVNDAPSIKAADIGVGMGITGTDVTKEAADIILTDDNFATIVGAVKEGRRIYNTILKIIMFLFGTSLAELMTMALITIIFRDAHFFTPALLLWINFVSDTFVGLALGFEIDDNGIMNRKPIKNKGSLFNGSVGFNIFCSAIFVFLMLVGLYCYTTFSLHLSSAEVSTICFLFLTFAELFHSFNLKSQTETLFNRDFFDNKILNWAFLVSAFLTVIIVVVPIAPIQNAMGITTISDWQWLMAIGLALLIVPYIEIVKFVARRVQKRRNK